MATASIRRAVASDLDALVRLGEAYCAADRHEFDETRVRSALIPLLVDDAYGVVLIAEADSVAIGYAVVTWGYSIESGGIESLLDEIYVAEPGRGIGSGLLEACLHAARDHGARTMFLETEAHNEGARRLYARHGFVIEDSVWMGRPLS